MDATKPRRPTWERIIRLHLPAENEGNVVVGQDRVDTCLNVSDGDGVRAGALGCSRLLISRLVGSVTALAFDVNRMTGNVIGVMKYHPGRVINLMNP